MNARHGTVLRLGHGMAVALLLVAGGCGGEEEPTTGQPRDGDTGAAMVSTRQVGDLGTVLVDADDRTLYVNASESDGEIRCVDACAAAWPPATVRSGSAPDRVPGVEGRLGEVTRPNGTDQLTLDGHPLYTFAEDDTGTARGHGVSDEFQGVTFDWSAARPGGADDGDDADDDSGRDDGREDDGDDRDDRPGDDGDDRDDRPGDDGPDDQRDDRDDQRDDQRDDDRDGYGY